MFTSEELVEGKIYTREQLKEKFNITDATINTGIFKPKGYNSIWLFVTEKKRGDMRQYKDKLEGDLLYWDGQDNGWKDKAIIEHKEKGQELLLFYRKSKEEFAGAGFLYHGLVTYISHSGANPSQFVLRKVSSLEVLVEKDIKAFEAEEIYREGTVSKVLSNKYERNPKLRAAAISIHGTNCQVCGFSFKDFYGSTGEGYIEVHHVKPISSYSGETEVDPKSDMAVLCSNCHRMVHRHPEAPLAVETLKKMIKPQS